MKAIYSLLLLSLAPMLRAQTYSFHVPASAPQEVRTLPAHVTVPGTGVALVADFEHKTKEGTVPVYLINQSGKDVMLGTQDGDPYLKLEFQDTDGRWKRAQPHRYSGCGNSYMLSPVVKSGWFVEFQAYQPAQGEKAIVRYRLHQEPDAALCLASNSGTGLINREDVRNAANDAMALSEGGFDLVAAVALGKIEMKNSLGAGNDLRREAIWRLSSPGFDPSEAAAVLARVAEDKDGEIAKFAGDVLRELRANAEARKRAPAKVDQEVSDPFAPTAK